MIRTFTSIILFATFTLITTAILIYFLTTYSNTKVINVVNFEDKSVSVELNDTFFILEPFDTRTLEVKDTRWLNIVAKVEEEIVYSLQGELPFNQQIIGIYFSSIEHCYYQTDLSQDLSSFSYTLAETNNNIAYINDVDLNNVDYIIAGEDLYSFNLKKRNATSVGVFLIPCAEKDSREAVFTNNKLFLNYNSKLQREYYFQNLEKVESTDSLDQLRNINGIINNEGFFFNFGGEKVLFLE